MGLGLEELIRAGKSPEEAQARILQYVHEPEIQSLLAELADTAEGRELLHEWCQTWARYGLEAPWAELPTAQMQGR